MPRLVFKIELKIPK